MQKKPAVSLDTFVAFIVEPHCPIEAAVGGGIALSKEEFEELQNFRQDISDLVPQGAEVQDTSTNGDSDTDDELAEKIGHSNISTLMRSTVQKVGQSTCQLS